MLQRKSKKILIYIFFFVFLGTINNLTIFNSNKFKINKFQITGLENNYKTELENNLLIALNLIFFLLIKII